MKPGCYLARDDRVAPPLPTTGVVMVELLGDIERLKITNLTGYGSFFLDYDDEHPLFVDDEEAGEVVIPTPHGLISLRWPNAEDFAALTTDFATAESWPELESDEERQAFLRSLTGDV